MKLPMNRPTLRRNQQSPEDTTDLLRHPATVPATIWAGLPLAACLATPFDQRGAAADHLAALRRPHASSLTLPRTFGLKAAGPARPGQARAAAR